MGTRLLRATQWSEEAGFVHTYFSGCSASGAQEQLIRRRFSFRYRIIIHPSPSSNRHVHSSSQTIHCISQHHLLIHPSSSPKAMSDNSTARALRHSGRRRQRDIRLSVRRIRATLGLKVRRDFLEACADIEMLEYTLEHRERGLGLVEGNFVAGFVDAEEADCEGVC
jgi:hypothetical protein